MEELQTNSPLLPTARKHNGAILLVLRGEIDLHNSPQIRTVVLDLIQKHKPQRVIFNVEGVAYMDSSGIAVLVEALKKLKPTGGKIYLMVSSDTDHDLFGQVIDKAGFNARKVREHSLVVESLILYELLPR